MVFWGTVLAFVIGIMYYMMHPMEDKINTIYMPASEAYVSSFVAQHQAAKDAAREISVSLTNAAPLTKKQNDDSIWILTGSGGICEDRYQLQSVTLPDSLLYVNRSAFAGCAALTSITIPASVTRIDGYAFQNCLLLSEINFNATAMNDLTYGKDVFYCAGQNGNGITVNIGANVTKIPANLFYCSYSSSPKITAVSFDAGSVCTEIGERAFYNCTALTSVTIPASVTTIGEYAFFDCSALTSVTFGNKEGWSAGSMALSSTDLQSTSTAATYLTSNYYNCVWTRTQP